MKIYVDGQMVEFKRDDDGFFWIRLKDRWIHLGIVGDNGENLTMKWEDLKTKGESNGHK